MLNYEVAADALAPYVPRGTTLDLWEGRALASVVGFRFLDTRVTGVPIPLHRDFDEVNLRFYVRRALPDAEVRRGVVFIRELVPRPIIAWVARALYNEPYRAVTMRSDVPRAPTERPGSLRYAWRRRTRGSRQWEHVAARAVGEATVPAAGTEAQFITEHYWGYTRQRDGGTIEYRVTHPTWRLRVAATASVEGEMAEFYGPEWREVLSAPPASAYLAEGSAVTVYRPNRIV